MKKMLATLAVLLLIPSLVFGGNAVAPTIPVQSDTPVNSVTVGSAATAITVTLTGVSGKRVYINSILYWCASGNPSAVTITDAGTTIFSFPEFNSAMFNGVPKWTSWTWSTALTGGSGNTVVVTVAACTSGSAATLTLQADQF